VEELITGRVRNGREILKVGVYINKDMKKKLEDLREDDWRRRKGE